MFIKLPKLLTVFFILIFLYSNTSHSLAQERRIRFQHLTIEDGLAQNMIDCMLQDSHGFMWFGTWNGLSRYDGYTFETFNNEHSPAYSLNSNFIYDLLEDPFGNLWIGTEAGLYIYLYDQAKFVKANANADSTHTLTNATVRTLTYDHQIGLIVGTEFGVSSYQILDNKGRIRLQAHYPLGENPGEINASVVNTLLIDRNNTIWVGTESGVFQLVDSQVVRGVLNLYNRANSLSSNNVSTIFEANDGDVWIGTEYGLNRFVPALGHIEKYYHDPNDSLSLVQNAVMDIIEDTTGNLIVATLGGLSMLDKARKSFTNYQNEFHLEHSLSNDFLNCLLMDDQANIWIGTERGGINYYNVNQNSFEHFENKAADPNTISNSTINSVYEDSLYLWIGTAGGGLNRYDKKNGTFNFFQYNPEEEGTISSDFITSIYRDVEGNLWVGTWGGGINLLVDENTTNPSFVHYHQLQGQGLVSNFISTIVPDQYGDLWIGTLGGLVYYDLKTKHFETKFSESSEARITAVGCLQFDKDNNLWAGTRNGLFQIHTEKDGKETYLLKNFKHEPSNSRTISANYITSALMDKEGDLWFGTYGQGLNRLHSEEDSVWFEAFTNAQGLSNNIIYSMLQDEAGFLWLATDFGLSRMDMDKNQFRNFYEVDGLLNNQYYWSASYKNSDGKLYFGGMNGLNSFFPDWVKKVDLSTNVIITDINLLNESVIPAQTYNGVEVLQESIFNTEEIQLSYQEKIFGVEFSSLNFQEPEMIRYAYILEGFEDDWNYVSSDRRYASYTNLRPGDYIFKVKASTTNGDFNGPVKAMKIYIAPPFWETIWFRIICIIAFVGAVFGYIRFRTYTYRRQKAELEKQVKERTEQIHQQKEALAFQAVQLQKSNKVLEENQSLITDQNHKLEHQNKEIIKQRDEMIKLNKKVKLVSQLKLSFFTNISHEFRTPLTLIIGPLERLLKEKRLNPEALHTLDIINRNAQRLLHLINQIMDFRKIEKGKLELSVKRANLSELCQNVYRAFEPLSDIKNIQFHYDEFDVPEEVCFDAQKIEHILYNLLSNAFKYTPPKGEVSFEVKSLAFEESKLTYVDSIIPRHKTTISIKISDTGLGISEENLPLVFKRFYRITSEEAFKISGSGIGLALTEELIKTHHGQIFVESKLGQGSEFEIQFPCLQDAYENDELSSSSSERLNLDQQVEILKNEFLGTVDANDIEATPHKFDQEKATILIVEDNLDLRKFISLRLHKNYNILEAGDGELGLIFAEKYDLDMVISDVMMPKVDGLKLCTTLKNKLSTCHIPIILLTAKGTVDNQIEGLELGADDYLPKPFNFEILESRIKNLIENRRKQRLHFLQADNISISKVTTNGKDQKFLEHAISVVKSNIEDSTFGVQELVKHLGISRSLLHKKLNSLINQSASEFINHLRLKKAEYLLRHADMNISEIAYAVGYNDPKYFTRLFSKQYGKSPSEFLKQALSIE